jgi:peptide/nickel transport system substrate-binding protein
VSRKILFIILALVLIVIPISVACKSTTTSSTDTSGTTVVPTTQTTITTSASPASTSVTTTTATVTQSNWWDKFGEPQYGGTINFRFGSISPTWDVSSFMGAELTLYFETMAMGNWTMDRSVCDFKGWIPSQYRVGSLAESWEQNDPQTFTFHIRPGIHWQNKAPVNGRELTAYDIEEHYARLLGTGHGYTVGSPMFAPRLSNWSSVTATDKSTIVIKVKKPSIQTLEQMLEGGAQNRIEAPEAVKAEGGELKDWTKAIGTGPWMLTEYVEGNLVTFTKNPDYWGYDERFPNNKLPYADNLKVFIIPDVSTAMAVMRAGKIDFMGGESNINLNWIQATSLAKTNPELLEASIPGMALGLSLRVDKTPFSDIRVRKALNMAIDRPNGLKAYNHGEVDGLACGIVSPSYKGYSYAFSDWPQSLKDEYTHNVNRAKELLVEAGYPDGFTTEVITPNVFDIELLEVFKANFADIGVDMTISAMDFGMFNEIALAGKRDAMAWWFTGGNVWAVDEFRTTSTTNWGRVNDPKINELADNVMGAANDTDLRKWSIESTKYILEQHYVVPACPGLSYCFWQPYLKGFSGEDLQWNDYIFARCWKTNK